MDERSFSPNFSPSRFSPTQAENLHQLCVHLPNKGFKILSLKLDETDVKYVIESLCLSSGNLGKVNPQFYALRLRHIITKEIIWLSLGEFILVFNLILILKSHRCFNTPSYQLSFK